MKLYNPKAILLTCFFVLLSTHLFSATYYWVGGSGPWSDYANHWATSSGGTTFYAQMPLANDDVIFDQNSFTATGQEVTIDPIWASCRSMNWTGVLYSPTLSSLGTGVGLKVYGDFTLANAMTFNFQGQLVFESTDPGNTIYTGSQIFTTNLVFIGVGGEWTLVDDISGFSNLTKGIVLEAGTLNTGSRTITTPFLATAGNRPKELSLGNSKINIYGEGGQYGGKWVLRGDSLAFYSGTSTINMKGASNSSFFGGNETYNKVNFSSPECSLEGNNTFLDSVRIHPGVEMSFYSNSNQYFQGEFIAEGNCAETITLRSTSGPVAYLHKSTGSVFANFVHFNSIHALGGSVFQASNSIDGGGNSGWTITPKLSQDYFWKSGTGVWSDTSHWSFSSGGPTAGCIPTSVDDVYFDSNSFSNPGDSVIIKARDVECRSLNWTGANLNPVLVDSGKPDLHVYGSLTLIPGMNWQFQGDLNFQSNTSGNSITSAGQVYTCRMNFLMAGGEWELQDPIVGVPLGISLNAGTLYTRGHNIKAGRFHSKGTTPRGLILDSSVLEIGPWSDLHPTWDLGAMNFQAGTSTIKLVNASNFVFQGGGHTYHKVISEVPKLNIRGSNTFQDSLVIETGSILNLNSGTNQTFNGEFIAPGNCIKPLRIQGTVLGDQAGITKNSGSIILENATLTDLKASGGGIFTANNSIDGGGVTGWQISPLLGKDFYWVHNSGNWSDTSHWSLSSGGPSAHCLPTQIDDVHFDAASFSNGQETVNIDIENAVCHDMDWLGAFGNPSFISPKLGVYGSLEFIQNMEVSLNSKITFAARDSMNTVTTAGKRLWITEFKGYGGHWELLAPLEAYYGIFLIAGSLETKGFDTKSGRFQSAGRYPRTLELDSSKVTVGPHLFSSWEISGDSIHFNSGSSTIKVEGPVAGNNGSFVGGHQLYHNVEFSASRSSLSGNNTFRNLKFNPGIRVNIASTSIQTVLDEFSAVGTPSSVIEIRASSSGSEATIVKDSGEVCAQYLELTDNYVTGGAVFKAGNSVDVANNQGWLFQNCTPLPIELLYLQAEIEGEMVHVSWATTNETNNSFFEILRSQNGLEFEAIGTLPAAGNSQKEIAYNFYDEKPIQSGRSFYRLRQIDFNGVSSETNIVSVVFDQQFLVDAHPNPFEDELSLVIHSSKQEAVRIRIVDLLGQTRYLKTGHHPEKHSELKIPTSSLQPGCYLLLVETKSGNLVRKKLIKN